MKSLRRIAYVCALVLLCGAPAARAQCPARTTVAETLYNADGSLSEGRVVIAWQTFAIGACQVAAGQISVNIAAGALSLQLYPNTTAIPAGTSYRVTYYLKSGRVTTEYWVVPASATPVDLAAVRSATVPVPNVMFSQTQVTNLGADLAKKIELPSPCVAGKFLQANGSAAAPQVDCVDAGLGGGAGTVTSVGLSAPGQFSVSGSPVTASGTLAFGWLNQSPNVILAGPASGGAAVPSFRALVAADIPSLDAAKISSGSLPDARVDDTITIANLNQVTTRNYTDLQNIPSAFSPAAHAIDGAAHSASGLTAGTFLKALTATTFGFTQVAFSNLSGTIAAAQQNNPATGAKGGVEAKTCSGTDKLSAIGSDGVPVCGTDQDSGGAHAMLSATHSDSTAAAAARGAIIAGIGASPKWEKLTIGSANRYLSSDGTDVAWGQVSLSAGVTSTLPVGNGGTGITSGTSGGVLCLTGSTTVASSGALTASLPVFGGGAGVCPSSGTRSGNTTEVVTGTGSKTSGNYAKWDANGNAVDGGGVAVVTTDTVTRDFPLACTNPRVKSLAGNAFFDVEGYTTGDYDVTIAKFTNNVDGAIQCSGFVPQELAATPAAKILFVAQPHVACGSSQNFRFNVRYLFVSNTGSQDAAMTAETEQSIPGSTTAHTGTLATFPSSGSLSSAPTAGYGVQVEIKRVGTSGSDNCEQTAEVRPNSVVLRVDVKVKN